MNILVFGGAGYIGAHVVLELLETGHNVVVFDNFSTGEILNIDDRSIIIEGDILRDVDLNKVFKRYKFDAVMHFCALKAPGASMINPALYSKINIIGSINILEYMIKYGVNKFIFSSSSSVYGEPKSKCINEDHPLLPINYYGFTKLEIERLLNWYSKITDINFLSLRYFNAAGYDLKARIKVPERQSSNLIPKIMKVLSGKQKKLEIFGSDYNTKDGTCIRDYIHVNDLATAHVESLNYLNETDQPLFLNLATGFGHTVLDVINSVEKLSTKKVDYKFVARREGDPSILISKTKYKKFPLNWRPINSDLTTIINSVLKLHNL